MQITSGLPALKVALSERNYRNFSLGNIVSHNGTWAQRIAVGWLAWELTKSPFWLGLVAVADLFPVVILAPLAGAMADRVNLLVMMKVTQVLAMVQSILLAVFTIVGMMTPELLLALVLIHGAVIAINQPVRLAIVPHLVSRENMTTAIGLNSMIFNSARFTGPMIGGLLIDYSGVGWAFLFNAISYVWFVVILGLIHIDNPRSSKERTHVREVPREIREGYRYASRHKGIARMLILLTVVAICGRPYMELLPGFVDNVFGRGAQGLAWLVSVTGLGAMCGGFWLAQRGQVMGLTRQVVIHTLVLGLSLVGFAATNLFGFALLCLFVTGFAMIVVGVGEQTLLQNAVDPAMRGRVMSLYGMIGRGAPAIGALAMGGLSETMGLQAPVIGGALICVLLWFWASRRQEAMTGALEKDPEKTG